MKNEICYVFSFNKMDEFYEVLDVVCENRLARRITLNPVCHWIELHFWANADEVRIVAESRNRLLNKEKVSA